MGSGAGADSVRPGLASGASRVTVIVPAFDEAATVGAVVAGLLALRPAPRVIVVDDGSRDGTGARAAAAGARVLVHPHRRGNGAAVKSGLAAAGPGLLAVLDADGQHDPARLPELLALLRRGADLAVLARSRFAPSGWTRALGNRVLCALAGVLSGCRVPDLTSGYRVARREHWMRLLPLLPDGFGTPAAGTLATLLDGRSVAFLHAAPRPRLGPGRSRTRLLPDGLAMLALVLSVAARRGSLRLAALGLLLAGLTLICLAGATWLSGALGVTGVGLWLLGARWRRVANRPSRVLPWPHPARSWLRAQ